MEIKRLKIITFISIIIVISILLGVVLFHTDYFKQTYIEPTPIEELLQKSDLCVLIDTRTLKTAQPIDYVHPNWPTGAETREENGRHYVDVFVELSQNSKIKYGTVLTIVQEKRAYLKPEKTYLVFLKKSETDKNCCYIVDEPNGIIETYPNLKPVNIKMKDEVNSELKESVVDWFYENVPFEYVEDKYSLMTEEELLTYSYYEELQYNEELKNEFFAEDKEEEKTSTFSETPN